ncbi:hypothetical protein QJ041_04365 [Olsenella sp. YH-ols2216]|nr:hypothetical protein [Olsenella sp. YH-ols2216]
MANVYRMMAYAWSALSAGPYASLSAEEFENHADLMAAILCRGVADQARRGFSKAYVLQRRQGQLPRGRLLTGPTVALAARGSRDVVCEPSELTADILENRAVKAALASLLGADVPSARRRELRNALALMPQVTSVGPRQALKGLTRRRTSRTYQALLAVSSMALSGEVLSSQSGDARARSFLDDSTMAALYERFLLRYFQREHPELEASAPHIPWDVDAPDPQLPLMRTDLVLRTREGAPRTLIVDAKYYGSNLSSRFGKSAVHSGNLYQLLAYVNNEAAREPEAEVSGLLLYAKTDAREQPALDRVIGGHRIRASALDLSGDFAVTRGQLDAMARVLA